jgi:site-specific DNA-methyltransferase (cytosine-N4-specific)
LDAAGVKFIEDTDLTVYVGDVREQLRELEDGSVDCVVTSPPYWGLRDYGADGQIGLEPTPEEYVATIVDVFREVRRVLADHGTCWINLGDSYAGSWGNQGRKDERGTQRPINGPMIQPLDSRYPQKESNTGAVPVGLKPKDLVGIPWRVAFALQADGWYLRSDIVWSKPNPMPESVTDRPTKSHEYVFLLTKRSRYFFDNEAVREPHGGRPSGNSARFIPPTGHSIPNDHRGRSVPWSPPASEPDPSVPTLGDLPPEAPRGADGRRQTHVEKGNGSIQHRDGDRWPNEGRNVRSVWEIPTQPYPEAHFATYPEKLVERCLLAGCPSGGIVLDPFLGSGTTAVVARRLGRKCIGVELNREYAELVSRRTSQLSLLA